MDLQSQSWQLHVIQPWLHRSWDTLGMLQSGKRKTSKKSDSFILLTHTFYNFIIYRFVCISDDLKFNGKNTKTNTIEANSLLMARNGICFIGDWMGLNVASLNYLRNGILF